MRASRRSFLLSGLACAMLGTPAGGVDAQVVGGASVTVAGLAPDRVGGLAPDRVIAPAPNRAVGATLRQTVIGRSQGRQPLTVYHIGGARRRVLILGGQHGAPEANAVWLADALLDHFAERPEDIPRGLGLDVLTVANPDGFIGGSRRFMSGVDPNRNWDSGDWQTDAYDSLGQLWLGLGGPAPMSEPETRLLAGWIAKHRPSLVVNYHSAGGFVSTGQWRVAELAEAYATAADYPFFGPDADPFAYPITGAMDGWLARQSIPDIFVELSTPDDPEIEENLAGLRAVLQLLAP